MRTKLALIATVSSLIFSSASQAKAGEWSFSAKLGSVQAVGGDVHQGPSFDGSVLLALPAGSLPVDVDVKDFDDVYGDFLELSLEFGYQASETLSYYFGLSQIRSDEGSLQVGTVAGTLPLNGTFSDYDDLGLYGGVTYNFETESNWRPRISAQLGVKEVDAITASFSVPDTPFVAPFQDALTAAPFYDDSTVWSFGLILGLDYMVADGVNIGLETGWITQESLDRNDSVLDVLGLGTLNDEGDLDYMPIRLSASFAF